MMMMMIQMVAIQVVLHEETGGKVEIKYLIDVH
jgi:hypothetical protein